MKKHSISNVCHQVIFLTDIIHSHQPDIRHKQHPFVTTLKLQSVRERGETTKAENLNGLHCGSAAKSLPAEKAAVGDHTGGQSTLLINLFPHVFLQLSVYG